MAHPQDDFTPAHHRPWSGLAGDDPQAHIGILGIPFDSATSYRRGAAEAPARLRLNTEHIAPITEEGRLLKPLQVRDYGDVARDLDWERYFATTTQRARQVLASHPFALFLGGDHSVTIPLLHAYSQQATAPFGILHIDAHTDLVDSYQGHRWSHACTQRRALEYEHVQPQNLVFCGIRSYVEEELDFLAQHPQIQVHSARAMHQRRVEAIARDVIAQLRDLPGVYLTLDIDCLDPAYAPGTGTPEAGGLTTRQLIEFLRLIFAELPVRAMDVVEVAPPLDYSDITSWAALKVIYEIFGWVGQRQ